MKFLPPQELFPKGLSESQSSGIQIILKEAKHLPKEQIAYLLATTYHETGRTFQPVRETFAKTDDQAISILENSFRKGRMPWVKTPYWRKDPSGKSWLGRGYVQLTHRENYLRASQKLNVDLVSNPDLAMSPTLAAKILVRGAEEGWFTGKKLSDYLPGDYRNARRIINGLESASLIGGYAQHFEKSLVEEKTSSIWVLLFNLILSLFGKKNA